MPGPIVISTNQLAPEDLRALAQATGRHLELVPALSSIGPEAQVALQQAAASAALFIATLSEENPTDIAWLGELPGPKAIWCLHPIRPLPPGESGLEIADFLFVADSRSLLARDPARSHWLPTGFWRANRNELLEAAVLSEPATGVVVPLSRENEALWRGLRPAFRRACRKFGLELRELRAEPGLAYVQALRRAQVVLNLSHGDDLGTHEFEAWGVNRILLTRRTPAHDRLPFPVESTCFVRRDLADLDKQLEEALARAEKPVESARFVLNGHTFAHRFLEIINRGLREGFELSAIAGAAASPAAKRAHRPLTSEAQSSTPSSRGNIGMMILSQRQVEPAPGLCATRLQIEDNVGEAIHLHWRNLRLDFSVRDFRALADGCALALEVLDPTPIRVNKADGHSQLAASFVADLGALHGKIVRAYIEEVWLDDLKVITYQDRQGRWTAQAIADSVPYRFLEGDEPAYRAYQRQFDTCGHAPETFRKLIQSLRENGYPSNGEYIVLHGDEPYIRDGQHRAAALRFHSGNIKVPVLRLQFEPGFDGWRMGKPTAALAPACSELSCERLLFVRTDSIGDNVLASSMLRPLRQRFPQAKIAVLCQEHVADLYLACPEMETVICFDKGLISRDSDARSELVKEIQQFGPDLILNSICSREWFTESILLDLPKTQAITIEGDLSNISPADRDRARSYASRTIPNQPGTRTELEHHRVFLEGLGITTGSLQPAVWTSEEDETLADAFFREHHLDSGKTIALFPSTQHQIKDYPAFAEALSSLEGYSFLIFGGAEAKLTCDQLAAQLPGPVFNLAGLTRLREMSALIKRCRILVGSDSCGAHMACAVGVPNVVVLGGGHFGRFFPYSALTSVVALPLACFGCNWRCSFPKAHCVKDLAPAVVAEALHQTLANPAARPRVFIQAAEATTSTNARPAWQAPTKFMAGAAVDIIEVRPTQAAAELPESAKDQVAHADAALAKGDTRQAIAHLEQARQSAPRHPDLLTALANLYFQADRMHEARAVLTQAAAANPRDPLLHVLLAHTCVRLEDAAGFEAALGRAFELDAQNAPALRLLADMHMRFGRFDEAARVYGSLVQRGELDNAGVLALGRCFVELHDLKGAHVCYVEILKRDPNDGTAQENLRIVEQRLRDAQPAAATTAPARHEQVPCPACGRREAQPVRQRADIVECGACKTVYLRTRLTKDAMRQLYQSYADGTSHMALPSSRAEAERSGLARDYFLREILEFVEAKGDFLDVGCGWGGFLLNARRHGFNPRGVELTRKCVRYANDELGIPVVDTQLEDTPLGPSSLQVVTMNHVLEHLPEPRQALAKVFASLKPGGMFCGMVPNFNSACSAAARDQWFWLDPQYHYTHFTPATLRTVLENAGFVVERLYTATGDYGPENVRKTCLAQDPQLSDSNYFSAALQRYEAEGRGEEIRFFARKPVSVAAITAPASDGPPPLVSVVVSTFNSEALIRPCLENLSRQTIFDRVEVIVVDSGSEQNERAVVEELQAKFPNLRYLRTERESLYAAWNRGLALARGKYWVNANTDDGLRTDALEVLVAALEAHPTSPLAYADCVWTSLPNDQFPSTHILKEVSYPHWEPVHTWFYCLTGCLQFWRTAGLRELGGFDRALRYAGDYEITLRLAAARGSAVHVPDFLSLFYQNTRGLTQQSSASQEEHARVEAHYRATMPIDRLFACRENNPLDAARAWTALGLMANAVQVPWERQRFKQEAFAFDCFRKAFTIERECPEACLNYLHSLTDTGRGAAVRELEDLDSPVLQEAFVRFRRGEGYVQPPVGPAVLGPIFDAAQAQPAVLQLEPAAIRPWVSRREGRFTYLSSRLLPRPKGHQYSAKELERLGKQWFELLRSFPAFHAHFGGAGDALLLLASFYDQEPQRIVLSYPNSVPATRAFFDAFPHLGQVYFLPLSEDPRLHAILRYIVRSLPNCLGAGATPKQGYDEWTPGLDLKRAYQIDPTPRWAAAFRTTGTRRVGLAPKGSLTGMVGSKKNVIDPAIYPQVVQHLLDEGLEPVLLGTPDEEAEYPVLPGCVSARSRSFRQQMEEIGRCAILVGADSWAKSFSALAQIPTIVFEPIKGADWIGRKDASDYVFLEPWKTITVVKGFDQFREAFARAARTLKVAPRRAQTAPAAPATDTPVAVAWSGTFLDLGSLSHVNRELTAQLGRQANIRLTRVGDKSKKRLPFAELSEIAASIQAHSPVDARVTVRHAWPPAWRRPAQGALVVIQPWEYGALPQEWLKNAEAVDEFWVPSTYVKRCYVESGVSADKVQVVPNGINPAHFHPKAKPLSLATRKTFKFLFVGGTILRKGADVLLRAYLESFRKDDDVCLVIKDFGSQSVYAGQTLAQQIKSIQGQPNAPEILYLENDLAPEDVPGLYTACDCLVHPYRGEGFGLPVLEAMACGRPVIVTAGGAADDFATDAVAFRIPAGRRAIGRQISGMPLASEGWLLEPDAVALGAQMKWVVGHPAESRAKGLAASDHAHRCWTWERAAQIAAARVRALAAQDSGPRTGAIQPPPRAAQPAALPAVAAIADLKPARDLLALKQLDQAWHTTIDALRQRPFHPEAFLLLGEIARAAGDTKLARTCANRARALAPEWKPARKLIHSLSGQGSSTKPEWQASLPSQAAPRLSVCLITKNEERFVAQAIQSVKNIASQIVVVDTGSIDRTIDIARNLGAEVFPFVWVDDFSAARNAALEHATGDWVLMLDADEELAPESVEILRQHLADPRVMAWRLPLVDVGRESEGCSYVPRLFRNAPGLHFIGRVHEQVFTTVDRRRHEWGLDNKLGQATLLHHGYTAEITRAREKIERNLRLLHLALQEQPNDPQLLMQSGLELARSGRDAEALERYRQAFQVMAALREIAPEFRETFFAQFCTRLAAAKRFDEIRTVLTSPLARAGSGLNASMHFALGLAHLELGDFADAAGQFQQCLAKRSQPSLCSINKDIHTAAPRHCLALCLAQLGQTSAAETAFQEGLKEPGTALRLDYARFLFEQQRPVEALERLHEAMPDHLHNTAFWRLGGQIALSQPQFLQFACDWTGEALRHLPDEPAIRGQRAEALLLSGDAKAALPLWSELCQRERQPRSLAALIFCQSALGKVETLASSPTEARSTTRAFLDWYRRCVAAGSKELIESVNERLPAWRSALPEAAGFIEKVLTEAAQPGA